MKILIVYHSKTGTTKKFAELIRESLRKKGHSVELIELKVTGLPKIPTEDAQIENIPDCTTYDLLLMGFPVWGFSATPVAITCMKKIKGIKGKRIIPFITMGFPFSFMGGKRAAHQINTIAQKAGAEIDKAVILPKMFRNYTKNMENKAQELAEQIR